jgi:hypothetical protein
LKSNRRNFDQLIFFFYTVIGFEPGTQYEYKYVGRSAAGIYTLKQQNAVIELQSRVIVQSIDENTIVVKVIFKIK